MNHAEQSQEEMDTFVIGDIIRLRNVNTSLQHQLIEALAACKGKDEALKVARNIVNEIHRSLRNLDQERRIIDDAFALQPSSTALSDYLREEMKGLVDAMEPLRRIVTRNRYKGADGRGPMTEKYHWPMTIRTWEEIGETARECIIAFAALARFQAAPMKETASQT